MNGRGSTQTSCARFQVHHHLDSHLDFKLEADSLQSTPPVHRECFILNSTCQILILKIPGKVSPSSLSLPWFLELDTTALYFTNIHCIWATQHVLYPAVYSVFQWLGPRRMEISWGQEPHLTHLTLNLTYHNVTRSLICMFRMNKCRESVLTEFAVFPCLPQPKQLPCCKEHSLWAKTPRVCGMEEVRVKMPLETGEVRH